MAKKYIEAEAAQADGWRVQRFISTKESSVIETRDITSLPAANVVEVVRCKDCKYRRDDNFCGGRGWPEQLVPDDGYCDKGANMEGIDNV